MDKKKFAVQESRLNCRRTDVVCKLVLRELKGDVISFIWRVYVRSVISDKNGAF